MVDTDIYPKISLDEIIESIHCNCSYEEIIQFIIDLDLEIGNCKFTSDLLQRLSESFEPDRIG